MLQNYFLTVLRNFRKNKLYTFINTGGLALGLAVALLIGMYVRNEMGYDAWIKDSDQIYRVYRNWQSGGNTVWTPDPLAEAMKEQIPEILQTAGLSAYGEVLLEMDGKTIYADKIAQVDSTFFDVIAIPFLEGSIENALINPNSLVLSSELASDIFGSTEPMGQIVRFNDETDLIVTGVLQPYEDETHLHYLGYVRYDWQSPSWTGNNRATYVLLNESANLEAVEQKTTDLVRPYWEMEIRNFGGDPTAQEFPRWKLQPIKDIHLSSAKYGWADSSGGDIKYIYIFLLIGAIVLFIAAINYINLSTARAAERAKEVGVRKVSGARKSQIAFQFLGESFLQTSLAFLLALGISLLFLPYFNGIVNRELSLLQSNWPSLLAYMLGVIVILSLVSGSYPAFLLSSYKPVTALKGNQIKGKGGQSFRRTLVVLQFTMSVILVIAMMFIYRQVNFMMSKDLGFSSEQVIAINMNNRTSFRKVEKLRQEFVRIPGVESISTASRMPGNSFPDWTIKIEGVFESHSPRVLFTDEEYLSTLDLTINEGRFFSPDFPTDSTQAFIVNEAFIRNYNIENPIGTQVKFSSDTTYRHIIGVINDFHYRGLDAPIRPLIMAMLPNRWYTAIRIKPENIPATINAIENLWTQVEPKHPMRYEFLDQKFGSQYDEYQRLGNALLYATVLALLVAMLGLFGLVTYTTTKRTKEIGIRKVLGASILQVSFMLMKDFVKWVLLASIMAVPISWFLVKNWLQGFAYQTTVSILPFIMAILLTLAIAAITVHYRTVSAARRDPVQALRYE